MSKAEAIKRLDEIEEEMWLLSMADYLRGAERKRYEALAQEKAVILREVRA